VLGRRNWLFTWLDEGGERTGDILSIIATCIAHDVNPRAYLHRVVNLQSWHEGPHAKLPTSCRTECPAQIVLFFHQAGCLVLSFAGASFLCSSRHTGFNGDTKILEHDPPCNELQERLLRCNSVTYATCRVWNSRPD